MKKFTVFILAVFLGVSNYAISGEAAEIPLSPKDFAGTIYVTGHGRNFYVIVNSMGDIVMAELTNYKSAGAHVQAMSSKINDFQLCKGRYAYSTQKQVIEAETLCPTGPYEFAMYIKGISEPQLDNGVKVKVKVAVVPWKVSFFAQRLDESEIPPSLRSISRNPVQLASYLP